MVDVRHRNEMNYCVLNPRIEVERVAPTPPTLRPFVAYSSIAVTFNALNY